MNYYQVTIHRTQTEIWARTIQAESRAEARKKAKVEIEDGLSDEWTQDDGCNLDEHVADVWPCDEEGNLE